MESVRLWLFCHSTSSPYVRVQVPLALGWALTIHRAQGMELDYVVGDLAKVDAQPGLFYTLLTRVRQKEHLALLNLADSPKQHIGKCTKVGLLQSIRIQMLIVTIPGRQVLQQSIQAQQ